MAAQALCHIYNNLSFSLSFSDFVVQILLRILWKKLEKMRFQPMKTADLIFRSRISCLNNRIELQHECFLFLETRKVVNLVVFKGLKAKKIYQTTTSILTSLFFTLALVGYLFTPHGSVSAYTICSKIEAHKNLQNFARN